MEILQFDFSGRGKPDIAETVYDALHDFLIPACQPDWVKPIFIPGHPCHDAYAQMLTAYGRLRDRLDATDADTDAEEMIDSLLTYSKLLGLEMFRYGQLYQKILDNK
jgi:hypothetical protein